MKKSIISGACAAALLAGLVFAAGCGRTSGADTEGKKPQTEETAAREEAAGEMEDQAQDGTVEETQYPLTVTDDLGNEVVIEAEPERIVSMSPANTETLFALGAGEQLVGRTDYCSYPQEAAEVPSVGSYSSPNTELIISMDADVIFASDYMDAAIRSQVENAGAKVIIFAANDLESVEADILLAGRVLNRNEEAKEITDGMEAEMAELEEILSANTVEKSAFVDLGDCPADRRVNIHRIIIGFDAAERIADDEILLLIGELNISDFAEAFNRVFRNSNGGLVTDDFNPGMVFGIILHLKILNFFPVPLLPPKSCFAVLTCCRGTSRYTTP